MRDYPTALTRFAEAGADVDSTRVRFPRGLARKLVSTAPPQYTQHARNPANSVQVGGDATVFAPNYGSPFVHDLDRGRRYATLEDFENIVKLAYLHPHLHHSGGTVCEPVDVPVSTRHLDMVYAHLRWSDMALMGSVTAAERAADSVELSRIAFGGDLGERTVLTSLINAASPLTWDGTMLGAAEVYAAANQATIITPFILAGAMAPATSAGVIAQTLAEALAGMAFVQLVRPGAPVVLGSFASSMSMQTGAPTFGTPEPAHVLYAMAALARRLGVPFRSGGSLTASKLPDAQAAYESAATLLADDDGRHPLRPPRRRLAGGRPGRRLREVRARRRPAGDDGHVRPWRRPQRERPGARRHPRQPAGQPLPRHRPHARQLRDRLLPLGDRRQLQLRAVARGRLARRRPAGRTGSGRSGWRRTNRPPSTKPSTRSCASTSRVGAPRSRMPSPDAMRSPATPPAACAVAGRSLAGARSLAWCADDH